MNKTSKFNFMHNSYFEDKDYDLHSKMKNQIDEENEE